jgi:hypothetical protein
LVEGLRSIVGTRRTKTGKRVAEGLLFLLFGVAFIVGLKIHSEMICW